MQGSKGAWNTLRTPHFRPLLLSNFLQVLALQTATMALQWLITDLTPSRTLIGMVGFVQFGAAALLSPVGGVVADRLPKRSILIGGRATLIVTTATLASLTLTGVAAPWQGLLAALCAGVVSALLGPAAMTYVYDVATRERAPRAVALNATATGSAMILGRALGGVIIAAVGTALTFFSAAGLFLVTVGLLLAIPIPGTPAADAHELHPLEDLRAGLGQVWRNPPLRFVLLACCMTIFNGAVFPMRSVFARYVLGEGSAAFGAMAVAQGTGALLAATVLTFFPVRRVGLIVVGSIWIYAWFVFAYAFADSLPYLLGVEFALGVAGQTWNIAAMAGLQLVVPEAMRGRVVGLVFTVAQLGFIGHVIVGALADQVGDQLALATFGAIPTVGLGILFVTGFPLIRQLQVAQSGEA